jgi:hypothetical protein
MGRNTKQGNKNNSSSNNKFSRAETGTGKHKPVHK